MQVKNCEKLIDLFHKAIETVEDSARVDFSKLNERAVRFGYIIHPDCCNRMVEKWLDTLTTNYNATFYKEWQDVISRDRFDLFVDQLVHYATTYGTEFSMGNGYVPNDGSTSPSFKNLKVIAPVSVTEMFDLCANLVTKGIALKKTTLEAVCDFIVAILKSGEYPQVSFSIDDVSCKEAQAYISIRLGKLPRDEFGMLRCLVYHYTGSTMLIKSRQVFDQMRRFARSCGPKTILNSLGYDEKKRLSRIFFRYKPLFLAMKTKYTAHAINEISRYARTNHRPMTPGFWESVVYMPKPLSEISKNLPDLDVFRKIRILQAVRVALHYSPEKDKLYIIRNGKAFLRKDYSPRYDLPYLEGLEKILWNSLVECLKKRACRVKLPKNFDLALPSSEKAFVGNLPFGTSIDLQRHNMFGIYWRNEWGAMDIDLSMVDRKGRRISWYDDYFDGDKNVIYSGDMTNADPEASEILYSRECVPDGIVQANLYTGDPSSRFRFFVATEAVSDMDAFRCGYMVDPNNIRMDTMMEFEPGKGQVSLGIISDGKFVVSSFSLGNCRVAQCADHIVRSVKVASSMASSMPRLKDVLLAAGFEIVDNDADIDLSDPTKDAILNLLKD